MRTANAANFCQKMQRQIAKFGVGAKNWRYNFLFWLAWIIFSNIQQNVSTLARTDNCGHFTTWRSTKRKLCVFAVVSAFGKKTNKVKSALIMTSYALSVAGAVVGGILIYVYVKLSDWLADSSWRVTDSLAAADAWLADSSWRVNDSLTAADAWLTRWQQLTRDSLADSSWRVTDSLTAAEANTAEAWLQQLTASTSVIVFRFAISYL